MPVLGLELRERRDHFRVHFLRLEVRERKWGEYQRVRACVQGGVNAEQ